MNDNPAGIQDYKHQGMERLNYNGMNLHDHGARLAFNALSRWMAMDPLMEEYYEQSPYVYCGNNPVRIIDPTGTSECEIDHTSYIKNIVEGSGSGNRIHSYGNYFWMNQKNANDFSNLGFIPHDIGKSDGDNTDNDNNNNNDNNDNNLIVIDLPAVDIVAKPSNKRDNILASGMTISLAISQLDSPLPGPADAIALIAAGVTVVIWGTMTIKDMIIDNYSPHITNKSPSRKQKHTKTRSGGDPEKGRYGKNRNDKKGNKNQKFIPSPNPNKK